MNRLTVKIILSWVAWLGAFAHADVIVLKNGDRLTGVVDSISSGRVLLKTEYAGNVAIASEAIAELNTDAAFDVKTPESNSQGAFEFVDGQQTLVSEEGTRPIALEQINTAGQNNLSLAALGAEWASRADLSAILSNGNSDTVSYNTLIESSLKRDTVEHAISLLISNEEAEGVSTKDQVDLDYGYKRFLSEKWYASGNAEYFQDKIKEIDQRITIGAGMGYQFWDDSFGAFSTDLGISAVREDLAGETTTNPALRWGLDYKKFLFDKRMELFHKQSVLFIPDSDRGEVIASSTGVRYALSDLIDSTARVDVNHETKPPPGSSKTDVTYTIGVGVKF